MTRKFKFLGYGNRKPYSRIKKLSKDYLHMNQKKFYWYDSPVFTVGKIYEALEIDLDYANGYFPEGRFIDDEGDEMNQELQFFEEVFEEDWREMEDDGVSPEELERMNQSALELEAQFVGE